jgi:hypothetical protein
VNHNVVVVHCIDCKTTAPLATQPPLPALLAGHSPRARERERNEGRKQQFLPCVGVQMLLLLLMLLRAWVRGDKQKSLSFSAEFVVVVVARGRKTRNILPEHTDSMTD